MDSSNKFAKRIHTMAGSAEVVRGLFNSLADPELISLSIGAPAKEALPVERPVKVEYHDAFLGRDVGS